MTSLNNKGRAKSVWCRSTLILAATLVTVLVGYCRGSDAQREGAAAYFPPPDSQGGWRQLSTAEDLRRVVGMDKARLDEAFDVTQRSSKNGGLVVVYKGWLVYERYLGLGNRDVVCNLASCTKAVTSIAFGIFMNDRPDLFPDGLDQKVFTPVYLPQEAFPLSDPAKADIKLGQLLSFTAGIRGNNPCYVNGERVSIDPVGPDGYKAMIDAVALGKKDTTNKGQPISAKTLWCKPGGGYSYATASIHVASMIIRHVTGMELEDFVRKRIAEPLGWGRFTYGYKEWKDVTHTPGGGGIAVRPTDMARFGYLLLHNGRWKDRQLVPTDYVHKCSQASPYNPHYPFSLQFDVNSDGHVREFPKDAYWKEGAGGHIIYIVPSLDLVVWKWAGNDYQYAESDTGFPLPPEVIKAAESRADWKSSVKFKDAERRILQKVIESITDTGTTSTKTE